MIIYILKVLCIKAMSMVFLFFAAFSKRDTPSLPEHQPGPRAGSFSRVYSWSNASVTLSATSGADSVLSSCESASINWIPADTPTKYDGALTLGVGVDGTYRDSVLPQNANGFF